MNCKPNDIARVLGESAFAGSIVRVLYLAEGTGILPDGFPYSNEGRNYPQWVLEFPGPITAPVSGGQTRMTKYGCGADGRLQPLHGKELDEATRLWSALSEKATA